MVSVRCENCERVVSAEGGVCPYCGTPIRADAATPLPPDPEAVYREALACRDAAAHFSDWERAGKLFASLGDFRDAADLAAACFEQAQHADREAIYRQALARQGGSAAAWRGKAELLQSIPGFRDADRLATEYLKNAEELEAADAREDAEKQIARTAEQQRENVRLRRRRRRLIAVGAAVAGALAAVLILFLAVIPAVQYRRARSAFDAGDWQTASVLFSGITRYRDSAAYLCQTNYQLGDIALQAEDYLAAEDYFDHAEGVAGAREKLDTVRGILYDRAHAALLAGDVASAGRDFDAIGGYRDAKSYKQFCRALRVWCGDRAEEDKLDLKKAEDAIWQIADGTWISTQGAITWSAATRDAPLPDLTVRDNRLYCRVGGAEYRVEFRSADSLVLLDGGDLCGLYHKKS